MQRQRLAFIWIAQVGTSSRMATPDVLRESWATRAGFILAAVGSAVGLGNVWRFPFQVGQEGGAAFLFIYLGFVVLIGFPAMLVEFVIGRHTKRNPVGALREFGGRSWQYVGGIFLLVGIVILSFYSVVAGWVLRYFLASLTGAYVDDPGAYFAQISIGWDAVLFHAIFILAVIAIVALGVQRGIELAARVMVPSIVVLLVGLAIYAFTLEGAADAYAYYLSPDLEEITANWQGVLPAAAGQALFTLSLGMGAMITYASYIDEDRNLGEDGGAIIAIDIAIAFVAGLVVFPIIFTAGVDPADPGPGAIFVSLADAFAGIGFGWLLGAIFFGAFFLAALTSAISIIEVIVSYAIDEHGVDRKVATVAIGVVIFLLGVPTALDAVLFGLYDQLAAEVLLVLGTLLIMVLVGWIAAPRATAELSKGIDDPGRLVDVWIWLVRVPVVVVLLVSLYLALLGFADFLQGTFLPWVREL